MTTHVTLVHGTFARQAVWCAADSPFANRLRATLPGEISFDAFQWSGANTLSARIQAAERLRSELCDAVAAAPAEDTHVVIAHSHGGAVAAYAIVRSAELVNRVKLVCLSTPFLVMDIRPLPRHILKQLTLGTCLILLGAFLTVGAFNSSVSLVLTMVLAAGAALVAWKHRAERLFSVRLFAESMVELTDASMLHQTRTLFVRSSGDEASLALLTMQFLTFLADRIWALGSRATPRTGIQSGLIALIFLSLGGAVALTKGAASGATTLLGFALLGLVSVLSAVAIVSSFLQLLMVVLGSVVSAITAAGAGWDLISCQPSLRISVEPTPPGTWQLCVVGAPESPKGLRHATHSDVRVHELVARWILSGSLYCAPPKSLNLVRRVSGTLGL